ncbi:Uncharacterized protein Adt_11061 [Abeliophyllum distichum]|uniref:Retrotransposon gag domain-containing protein n=1 Tax=Abeliophyllum distichum TaxID=126358 RepID=A0ABD1ULW6_9LAMI
MDTRQKTNEDHWKRLEKDVGDLSTAFTALSGKADSSDKILKTLCGKQEKIESYMHEMNDKYDSIVAMLAKLSMSKDKQPEGTSSGSSQEGNESIMRVGGERRMNRGPHDVRLNTKLPKIDFPQFGGENPTEWVRKANKYFQIHQIPEEMKLEIAVMYLKGRADVWFHGFLSSYPNAGWGLMATELCRRFTENTGEEVVDTFSKISSLEVLLITWKSLRISNPKQCWPYQICQILITLASLSVD